MSQDYERPLDPPDQPELESPLTDKEALTVVMDRLSIDHLHDLLSEDIVLKRCKAYLMRHLTGDQPAYITGGAMLLDLTEYLAKSLALEVSEVQDKAAWEARQDRLDEKEARGREY